MNSSTETIVRTEDRAVFASRVLDAPRELVFQAFTDPARLAKWYGPFGFRTSTSLFQFEPGGEWHFVMHGPDGVDYPNFMRFLEIVPNEKISYIHSSDSNYSELMFTGHIHFEPRGDKTEIQLSMEFSTAEQLRTVAEEHGAIEGARQHLERLADHVDIMSNRRRGGFEVTLPSDLEIRMTRWFLAPAKLVFEAMTQVEHVKNWWGCETHPLIVCEIDLRVGGQWRYVMQEPSGAEHPFKGEFMEIERYTRLVRTEIYDVAPFNAGHAVVTGMFQESDGKTLLTETMRFDSKESRDGTLATGMAEGAALALDRLADLVQ